MANPHHPPQTQNQPQNHIVNYTEAPRPAWQQITETPKQKAVNYFSSCLEVLGIQEEVALTPETLKFAYKKAALKAHPDKGGNDQLFEAVTRAYAYLNEILLRVAGGRERGLKEVEAPTALQAERQTESNKWQHIEPVRLNTKKLDMNAFNRMFEQTHIPDPDGDGYGDWLKSQEAVSADSPKFSGKFNRDVFNNMFQENSKKSASASAASSVMLHPSAMALAMAPQLGTEIGRGRPDSFTAAPNDKFKFTDLRDAYTKESTFSGQVADVRVEQRNLEQYRANREKAPDPYSATEMDQLKSSEAEVRRREEIRQRRKAEQDLVENDYFQRMKQLVITNG
jgi:curved DNA-binding protein CbpA